MPELTATYVLRLKSNNKKPGTDIFQFCRALKKHGTIEQLLASPLTPFQVMFSKVLAMMLVMSMVLPMVMLSGTHTPLESMPAWLRHLMSISPVRYFIE